MEHVNAEILRAIADGKIVQYRKYDPPRWEPFQNADTYLCWKLLTGGSAVEWRIATETIKIGDHEVPEPCREAPKVGQTIWAVNPFSGPQRFTWGGDEGDRYALDSGFVHLTKEAARQHYEAIKSLLKEK